MSARLDRHAWAAAVALVWAWAWLHLAGDWRAEEQYRFGFGVPLLAMWVAWQRRGGAMAAGACNPAWCCALVFSLLLLLAGESLRRHDPLWRLTGASLFVSAALLTGAWLHRTTDEVFACVCVFYCVAHNSQEECGPPRECQKKNRRWSLCVRESACV